MKTIANTDIREAAKKSGICLWQVAEAIGISDASFSRKLRRERVMGAIEKLAENSAEVQ